LKITKPEYRKRIDALCNKLKESNLETLIISEEEDIYYLTGLTYKSLERLFLLVIRNGELTFILPKMELAHLKEVDHVDHIKCYREYPARAPERWEDVMLQVVDGSRDIGVGSKSPFEIIEVLRSASLDFQLCNHLEELRWIKSEAEIELIKAACKYSDYAIAQLNRKAYYGMTELEVFSIGRTVQQKVIKETDFDYLSSNVLVAAWPSRISHQPHGVPRVSDVLVEGSHISLAFLRVNGYAAELERTFFTQKPSNDQIEVFELMMETRRRCYQTLKAGVPAEEVDLAARHFLEGKGYKENIMHRSGHGIGLGNHEGPYLAEGDKTILQEDMVVSIEPGIYIEGIGGYRHSDTVRITRDGYEILTSCPDDLESLTFTSWKPFQKLKGSVIRKMFAMK
jgi:Xaa-Pro aminopeptidase